MSPSNGVENSQGSSIEASPETLHVTQEPEIMNAPATLLFLPTELILAVAHYLSPCGYMSLSYSCRTIRIKMGASIAHVLGDKVPMGQQSGSTLSIESRNIRFLERLDLRSMLDHDRKFASSKEFLAQFEGFPYHSRFSVPARTPLRREWRCSGNAGLLWICPHRKYDYKEATGSRGISDSDRCECSPLFLMSRQENYFTSRLEIMRVPGDLVPSYEEVREGLRPLNAPVCPHLRLKDACVGGLYHLGCRKIRWNPGQIDDAPNCGCGMSPSLEEPWFKTCNFCGTMIIFDIDTERDGSKTVVVIIGRSIEGMPGCTDRAWIAQVAQPADFEEYERAWQATHAECLRRVQSFSLI